MSMASQTKVYHVTQIILEMWSHERVETKIQEVLGADSYVCRSCRGNTGRGPFCNPPPPILNRVNSICFT